MWVWWTRYVGTDEEFLQPMGLPFKLVLLMWADRHSLLCYLYMPAAQCACTKSYIHYLLVGLFIEMNVLWERFSSSSHEGHDQENDEITHIIQVIFQFSLCFFIFFYYIWIYLYSLSLGTETEIAMFLTDNGSIILCPNVLYSKPLSIMVIEAKSMITCLAFIWVSMN